MINKKSELATAFWEKGRLDDDCPIYDFHGHMGLMDMIYFPAFSAESMVETLKRCGAKRLVFCHHRALKYPEGEEDNLEAVLKFPDYFYAYHAVIPNRTSPKEAFERVESYKDHYFGFKIHCDWHKTPLTDPAYESFLEYINRNKLPTLLHTWGA